MSPAVECIFAPSARNLPGQCAGTKKPIDFFLKNVNLSGRQLDPGKFPSRHEPTNGRRTNPKNASGAANRHWALIYSDALAGLKKILYALDSHSRSFHNKDGLGQKPIPANVGVGFVFYTNK